MPDRATVDRFEKTLSQTQAIPLVVAYLQDHCPLPLRPQVVIRAKPPSGKAQARENMKIDLARFPTHQSALIQGIVNIVTTDARAAEFFDSLIKFCDTNRLSKPNSQ
jgi:hypothetical protein